MNKQRVIIVGGGPAGLMAAGVCARRGCDTLLLERNARPARKLMITGKGRCNLANDCDAEAFIKSVPGNGRFLFGAAARFGPPETIRFFEDLGLPLKTERGNRVFPASDRAADVVDTLVRFATGSGCRLRQARVTELSLSKDTVTGVVTEDGERLDADAVLICTGGQSYPATGSTGDGYALARKAGHTVIPPVPSLVPLVAMDFWCADAQGLALRNVAIEVTDRQRGKLIYRDFGELLFTHFGLSGPVILSASAHMRPMERGRYRVSINLKPALTPEQLDARLVRDFQKYQNRIFSNSLVELLPKSLIPVIIRLSGIPPDTQVNAIPRADRLRLVDLLRRLPVDIAGFRPFEEAIVTAGGVSVREVDPKTMASKLVGGLYFAGEVLDLDAYTGGFNLQIAFSTGHLAGESIANF